MKNKRKLIKSISDEDIDVLFLDRFLAKVNVKSERIKLISIYGQNEKSRRSFENKHKLPLGTMDFLIMREDPEINKLVTSIREKLLKATIEEGDINLFAKQREELFTNLITEISRRYPLSITFLTEYQKLFNIEQEKLDFLTKEQLIPTQIYPNLGWALNIAVTVNLLVGVNLATTAAGGVKLVLAVVLATKTGIHDIME